MYLFLYNIYSSIHTQILLLWENGCNNAKAFFLTNLVDSSKKTKEQKKMYISFRKNQITIYLKYIGTQ